MAITHFDQEEQREIREIIGGTPIEEMPEVESFTDSDLVPFIKVTGDNANPVKSAAVIKATSIGGGSGGGEVTGVKGESESSYRKGNVNITKANIGLGNVDDKSSATLKGEIMTGANVKSALGCQQGGTKYLKEDGSWDTPAGGGVEQIQSDWNQTNTSAKDFIKNKPTKLSQFNNDNGYVTNETDSLTHYYKNTEVYTKVQTNNIVSRTPESDIVIVDTNSSIVVGDIFPHDASDWEMGSLDGDTEIESTVRCRTKDFISIDGATLLNIARQNTSLPMDVGWYYYDENKHSIGSWSGYTSSGQYVPISGAKYMRVLVKPGTEGSFSMTPERAATAVTCTMTVKASLDMIPLVDRPNKLFRTPGPESNQFSDWAWDGTKWVMLAVYSGSSVSADLEDRVDILQEHVDTVTQEGGRYDIFPQNYKNETLDNQGNPIENSIRLLSGYVKVDPYSRYVVEKGEDADVRLQVAANWFDGDKTYTGFGLYITGGYLETLGNEYVRINVRYNNDTQISPLQFVPFSMKKVDVSKLECGYFITYASDWEYGSFDNQGQPSGSVQYRIRTKSYHSIENGKFYKINYDDTSWVIDLFLYDDTFTLVSESGYLNNESTINVDTNVFYYKILLRPTPDAGGTINIQNAISSGISILSMSSTNSTSEVVHLRFAQWNIGLLNYGLPVDGKWGIPDDEVAEKLPGVKNMITSLNADVLIIDEYSSYVDRSYTMDSYDTIFKHFYPYRQIWGNAQMAVFSKYPLFLTGTRIQIALTDYDQYPYDANGRPCYYGYINILGNRIGLVSCHLSPYSSDRRRKEAAAICELMSDYDKCIIAGDMNSEHGAANFEVDMAPFRTAGYDFGNGGYWGYKNTYKLEYANPGEWYIDNTLVKGASINFYEVGSDRSISDHFPTKSEISILT